MFFNCATCIGNKYFNHRKVPRKHFWYHWCKRVLSTNSTLPSTKMAYVMASHFVGRAWTHLPGEYFVLLRRLVLLRSVRAPPPPAYSTGCTLSQECCFSWKKNIYLCSLTAFLVFLSVTPEYYKYQLAPRSAYLLKLCMRLLF